MNLVFIILIVCSFVFINSQALAQEIDFNNKYGFQFLNPGFFPFTTQVSTELKLLSLTKRKVNVEFVDFTGFPCYVAPAVDFNEIDIKTLITGNQTITLSYSKAKKKSNVYGLSFTPNGPVCSFSLIVTPIQPPPTSSGKSSSGSVTLSSSGVTSSGVLISSSSSSGNFNEPDFIDIQPLSSSSSGTVQAMAGNTHEILLSNKFSGIWKAEDERQIISPDSSSGLLPVTTSSIFLLELCVSNGKLTGMVNGEDIEGGIIVSQLPITEEQVNVVVKDKNNKLYGLKLNLAGKKLLIVTINTIHSVDARKVKTNTTCLN